MKGSDVQHKVSVEPWSHPFVSAASSCHRNMLSIFVQVSQSRYHPMAPATVRDPAHHGCWVGSQWPSIREFNDKLKSPLHTTSYFPRVVCYICQTEFKHSPSVVGKVLHREAELLDTEPFADDACRRQKGPLLRCQDNATAAIVKSQSFCVVDFSASLQRPTYSQHTETHSAQTHTKTTEKCDRIGRFFFSEDAARRKKKRDGVGQKRSISKSTFESLDQTQRRKEKHVCREEEK